MGMRTTEKEEDEPVRSDRPRPGATFDRERALAGVDGDRELLAELAGLFREDCPRLLAALRAGGAAGDAEGVARAAHAIRGSVGIFGALRAATMAAALEEAPAGADVASLCDECERLLAELLEFVGAPEVATRRDP